VIPPDHRTEQEKCEMAAYERLDGEEKGNEKMSKKKKTYQHVESPRAPGLGGVKAGCVSIAALVLVALAGLAASANPGPIAQPTAAVTVTALAVAEAPAAILAQQDPAQPDPLQEIKVTQAAQTVDAGYNAYAGTQAANNAQVSLYTQQSYFRETDHATTLTVAAGQTTETALAGHSTQTAGADGATQTAIAHIPTRTAVAATQVILAADAAAYQAKKVADQKWNDFTTLSGSIAWLVLALLGGLGLMAALGSGGKELIGVIADSIWDKNHPSPSVEYIDNDLAGVSGTDSPRTGNAGGMAFDGVIKWHGDNIPLYYAWNELSRFKAGEQLPAINSRSDKKEYYRMLGAMAAAGVVDVRPNDGSYFMGVGILERACRLLQTGRDPRLVKSMLLQTDGGAQ
jgi:hypothetical protein